MAFTVTGKLFGIGPDASVTWDDGVLRSDDLGLLCHLNMLFELREKQGPIDLFPPWPSSLSNHLSKPLVVLPILVDELGGDLVVKLSGDLPKLPQEPGYIY